MLNGQTTFTCNEQFRIKGSLRRRDSHIVRTSCSASKSPSNKNFKFSLWIFWRRRIYWTPEADVLMINATTILQRTFWKSTALWKRDFLSKWARLRTSFLESQDRNFTRTVCRLLPFGFYVPIRRDLLISLKISFSSESRILLTVIESLRNDSGIITKMTELTWPKLATHHCKSSSLFI